MATVPNYYYNSPWIADAARNLASAFAPPDRDKLMAREQNKWEFEYAKTKAANEEADRTRETEASGYLGELALLYKDPVLNAEGKPDLEATRAKAAGLMDKIVTVGGPKFVNEAESVAGPLSAAFVAKQEFKSQSDAAAMRRLGVTQSFQAGEGEKNRDFQTERDELAHKHRLEYLDIQGQQHIAEINLRNQSQQQANAITLTPAMGNAIMVGIYQRMRSTGKKMGDAEIYKMFDEIAHDTSVNTHNYATSLSRVWDARFPGGVYQKPSSGFFGWGETEYLTPNFENPLPEFGAATDNPAQAPRELADPIVNAGPPPAAAPTADAPRAATPPPKPTSAKPVAKKRWTDGRMLPAPTNKAERDSLPSGTDYIAPTNPPTIKTKK
ncbi:MAG TPA: hypothetical protein VFB63_19410 [Bryobacteraceae bacterium]|nr:hypothetical protein [Bryobacteraceae bacterium]